MMQHFLFIANFETNSGIYLCLDKQVVTRPAQNVQLDEINNISENDSLCLVLADQLVSNYELDLKVRKQSQLIQAASYAVEERFPGRLEDYHIVTDKGSRSGVSVRAIKHERFNALLERLKVYQLHPQQVLVESDLLNSNIATLLFGESEATLCGDQLEQTYEFDAALIPIIGNKIFAILEQSKELQIIYPPQHELILESLETQAPTTIRIKKILKNERYYETLSQNSNKGVNLLKGDFSVLSDNDGEQSYWKYPAWLTAASLVIFSGSLFAQNMFLENRIEQSEEQLLKTYTEIFPNASKPRDAVDVANKIKAKNKQNRNSPVQESNINILELLSLTTQASTDYPVKIAGIDIDNNSADLLVTGSSIDNLNKFKQKLAELSKSDLSLNMDNVVAKDDTYEAKISIR